MCRVPRSGVELIEECQCQARGVNLRGPIGYIGYMHARRAVHVARKQTAVTEAIVSISGTKEKGSAISTVNKMARLGSWFQLDTWRRRRKAETLDHHGTLCWRAAKDICLRSL